MDHSKITATERCVGVRSRRAEAALAAGRRRTDIVGKAYDGCT